ncbi:hypothetical protein [Arthrobacter sp. SX1312]|uniref:hypothetical protein n=1 Tax=Arthrobacter sp. SX1312 TaxID=2058896 RepID=UPI000CE40AB6|nr:hypothetical protein [Arthrobacter sp. SX1312]
MTVESAPVLEIAERPTADLVLNAENHLTRSLLLTQDNQPVHALAQLRAAEGFLRTYIEIEITKP